MSIRVEWWLCHEASESARSEGGEGVWSDAERGGKEFLANIRVNGVEPVREETFEFIANWTKGIQRSQEEISPWTCLRIV